MRNSEELRLMLVGTVWPMGVQVGVVLLGLPVLMGVVMSGFRVGIKAICGESKTTIRNGDLTFSRKTDFILCESEVSFANKVDNFIPIEGHGKCSLSASRKMSKCWRPFRSRVLTATCSAN